MNSVPPGVGERVSELRKARRWSQARLAVKSGVSRASIYRIEAGRAPLADTLFRLAHAFDLPIGDLVPSWPEWEPVAAAGIGVRTRQRRRALGISVAELALAAGVSEAALSRHERGIGWSPSLVRRIGDEYAAANDGLARRLGFVDADEFDLFCDGALDQPFVPPP